jgi:hypothetical protein
MSTTASCRGQDLSEPGERSRAAWACKRAFPQLVCLIQWGMQMSEATLDEFIKLYQDEFAESIDRDEARIIARNLVMFYLDLEERGVISRGKSNM